MKTTSLETDAWPTAKTCQTTASQRDLALADNRSIRFDELRSVFDELSEDRTQPHPLSVDDYFPKYVAPSFTQSRLHAIRKRLEEMQTQSKAECEKNDKADWLLKGLLGA